jgi:hypothetical protein
MIRFAALKDAMLDHSRPVSLGWVSEAVHDSGTQHAGTSGHRNGLPLDAGMAGGSSVVEPQ